MIAVLEANAYYRFIFDVTSITLPAPLLVGFRIFR